MSEVALRLQNLSKRYRIGLRNPYRGMHAFLEDIARAPLRHLSSLSRTSSGDGGRPAKAEEHIWALRDVSFEVQRGETVGIIGPNGAGKSVLLKILSRVTKPTEGYAEVRGQVGAMLEVGTGFHPDFTGRENVYLSGGILGMKKAEINRKFDEIAAFSGAEKFLDTPVKWYSNGMRVRLAFAVAVQAEPEIMLIDEVLAVGDDAFREKSLNKIREIAAAGRTVLVVSHSMEVLTSLCKRTLLLDAGRLVLDGEIHKVVARYRAHAHPLDRDRDMATTKSA